MIINHYQLLTQLQCKETVTSNILAKYAKLKIEHSILAAKHSKGFYKSTKQAERIEKSGLIGKKDMRNQKNSFRRDHEQNSNIYGA